MATWQDHASLFRKLHVPGTPVILFNIWDPGSAKTVAGAGAKALATGSWPVAIANGFEDGEKIPLDLAMAILARITAAVELPVSVDLEGGYGAEAEIVAHSASAAIQAGAIGYNFEDGIAGTKSVYPIEQHVSRIAAMRKVSKEAFLNARTDLFLKNDKSQHAALLPEAITRSKAFAEHGADGFFAPGLYDERLIAELCRASPIPVNIIALGDAPPTPRLAELGVARVSHGPGPYRLVMKALADAARLAHGQIATK